MLWFINRIYIYNLSFFFFQCLLYPLAPQYGGGLVANPTFDNGLEGWGLFGQARIEIRRSRTGNQFIVAKHRIHPYDSFSQRLHLIKGQFYTFSGNLVILFLS